MHAQTVVFAESGSILGTASLVFFSPTLCEIRALVITAESAQGRGIGKDLVLAAEAKALLSNRAQDPCAFSHSPTLPNFSNAAVTSARRKISFLKKFMKSATSACAKMTAMKSQCRNKLQLKFIIFSVINGHDREKIFAANFFWHSISRNFFFATMQKLKS
jgi:hypothetical protein